ncbi:MAG: FtsX-like permease family protein [Opitutaceae bacterium]|nr:FtsX-like permease family protein [Opitutaceae bacterium]
MKFLALVLGNLRRKKLRTALTVLSILVAFLLYGLLCVVREALTAGVSMAGADRLVTRHRVSIIQLLPQSYTARMERIPGVAAVAHQTWFGGIYQDPKNFFPNMPVDPARFMDMFPEFRLTDEEKKAWLSTRTGAVVGRTTADRFGWKLGDTVPLQSPIWGTPKGDTIWNFQIVGIYEGAKKNTDASQLFFRYDYFDEARQYGRGEVGWYTIRIEDPDKAAEVAAAIDAEFSNSPAETKTEPEGAFAQGFAQQVGNIGAIMLGIQSAVFFTILLVAGNTMAQAIRERTNEIGVLKAIGFRNGTILGLVLAESCTIAALGGLAGLGLCWVMTLGGSPAPAVLPVFYFPPANLLIGVLMVVGLGLVAGAFPAWQATRLRVADALRRSV